MLKMKLKTVLRLIHLWPPFLGAGIRVTSFDPDLTTINVAMKLRFWNRNYVGTHFGGSLYAMTDSFFMLILLEHLGRDYIVWDKSALINYKKPGKGRVSATFHIPKQEIEAIKQRANEEEKIEPKFVIHITDDDNQVIAEVEKTLYVRRKQR